MQMFQSISGTPLVTIIIRTCRGRLGFLREAVASALVQRYQPIEIVVIEDGSDDAQAWLTTLAASNAASIVHHPIPKAGRCRAGNVGLGLATGEFAVFLDDDDLIFPGHVVSLAPVLAGRPDLAAVYSLALETPTVVESRDPLRYKELGRYLVHRQPFSRPVLRAKNFLPIQSVLFRRLLFDRYGGFDERLDCLEDWDLWRRYSAEAEFGLVDDITSLYRVPGDPDSAAARALQLDSYREAADRGSGVLAGSGRLRLLRRARNTALRYRWSRRLAWHGRHLYYRSRRLRSPTKDRTNLSPARVGL